MCQQESVHPVQDHPHHRQAFHNEIVKNGGSTTFFHMVEVGLILLVTLYTAVYQLFPNIPMSANFCTRDDNDQHQHSTPDDTVLDCHRPDLVAYKVTAAVCMLYMGLTGVYNWHVSRPVRTFASSLSSQAAEDRLFGYLAAAERQNVAIFCYQVWDFGVSLTIPEHADPLFLVHHFLAAVCAWYSLRHQMVPYYAIYFGGCSELSSIFLVFADLDQFIPPTEAKSAYNLFILACKGLFVLTFAYFRVVGWWRVSYSLWSDAVGALRSGAAEKHRPGKSWFLYVFLTLNVVLGCLQLYWFAQIGQKVQEML